MVEGAGLWLRRARYGALRVVRGPSTTLRVVPLPVPARMICVPLGHAPMRKTGFPFGP